MQKRDIHHHKAIYNNWKDRIKKEGIEGLNKTHSDLLKQYIFDMELGKNVGKGSKKGARSYGRLNVLRQKIKRIIELFEEQGVKDIRKIKTSDKIHKIINGMEKGVIKNKSNNKPIKYVSDYVSNFKAFWNWWIKTNRLKGILIPDITEDLSTKQPEPEFVYLTKYKVDEMLPYFNTQQQILIKFLFDSIIRFPTECLSLKVKDIYLKNGDVWLNIPDEISKTFGRTFNLIYCGDSLFKYIQEKELKPDDLIFTLNYRRFNEKLKSVAKQLWGDEISHPKAKKPFSDLTGYDFRHSGAIHLRQMSHKNTNISLDAIRQRGGWNEFKMLNYYTQFLGLTGEIKKEDLIIADDKTKIEKKLEMHEKILKELIDKSIKNSPNDIIITDENNNPLSSDMIIKKMLK